MDIFQFLPLYDVIEQIKSLTIGTIWDDYNKLDKTFIISDFNPNNPDNSHIKCNSFSVLHVIVYVIQHGLKLEEDNGVIVALIPRNTRTKDIYYQ